MKRGVLSIFLLLLSISSWAEYREGLYRPSAIPMIDANMEYRAKDFSYLLGKMTGFSDSLLSMHFTLYQGYVKNSNALASTIREMRLDGKDRTIAYGALLRRFAWEFDGMYLHELYFENLGGKIPLKKDGALYKKIV